MLRLQASLIRNARVDDAKGCRSSSSAAASASCSPSWPCASVLLSFSVDMLDRHGDCDRRNPDGRWQAVMKNPLAMAVWGLIVAALLVIGSLPLFVGLAVVSCRCSVMPPGIFIGRWWSLTRTLHKTTPPAERTPLCGRLPGLSLPWSRERK